MLKTIVYVGSCPWKYFLHNILSDEFYEVDEEEFFSVVGYDRRLVPMHYHKDNINRQDFFMDNTLIGYRTR